MCKRSERKDLNWYILININDHISSPFYTFSSFEYFSKMFDTEWDKVNNNKDRFYKLELF